MWEVARSNPALPAIAGRRLEALLLPSVGVGTSAAVLVSARVAAPRSAIGFPVSVDLGNHT